MAIDSKHPLYTESEPDWIQLRDTYKGERAVKEKGSIYLPMTAGMIADGATNSSTSEGGLAYAAYKTRAVFPELVKPAVETMIGVMHQKEATIELPEKMEPMREKATLRGESLLTLLRRINEEQLVTGRLGLMLEVPSGPGVQLPNIALYQGEDVINWDDSAEDEDETQLDRLDMVVLNESGPRRINEFEWEDEERYRVLSLGKLDDDRKGKYQAGVFKDGDQFSEAGMLMPVVAGSSLEEIPFTFVNVADILPEPSIAPLLGLSNLALTAYRGEADYRQTLFMQGQSTLTKIGDIAAEGEETRVGNGAVLNLPPGGDAKYITPPSDGIAEQRVALENDYERGEKRADGLIDATSRAAESGESLRVRVAAKTASLTQIAKTGAGGLEAQLKLAAVWIGANPDEVSVTPNLDFADDRMEAAELTGFMAGKSLGAPIALETIHESMQERGLTKLTWDEEKERMRKEAEEGLPGATVPEDDEGATNSGSPEDDEDLTETDDGDDDGEDS